MIPLALSVSPFNAIGPSCNHPVSPFVRNVGSRLTVIVCWGGFAPGSGSPR